MGFSAGTAAVFPFITDSRFQSDLPDASRVKGGVLLYPWAYGCMNPPAKLTKPTLFIGAADDNVMRCWEASSWLRNETQLKLITLEIFKGVTHAFDNVSIRARKCTDSGRYPYCMEYNAEAHQKAEERVLKFLMSVI
jgi:dienelactone hydrolase